MVRDDWFAGNHEMNQGFQPLTCFLTLAILSSPFG